MLPDVGLKDCSEFPRGLNLGNELELQKMSHIENRVAMTDKKDLCIGGNVEVVYENNCAWHNDILFSCNLFSTSIKECRRNILYTLLTSEITTLEPFI